MESQKKETRLKEVDVLSLKHYGLSNERISKMVGFSIKKIEYLIKKQEQLKKISGVF